MSEMNVDSMNSSLDADETETLISADKVEGTSVYDIDGTKVGTVDSIMLNKLTGKVAYSVMSFGGFLGIGERYHPLPWDVLTYDVDLGGYKVHLTADKLKDAPNFTRSEIDDRRYADNDRIGSWYGSAAHPLI